MFKQVLKKQHGYSLLELVLVIALIGIFGAVAVPYMSGVPRKAALDTASKKIFSDLRYAQDLAMTSGESYGFKVTSTTTYEIYKVSTGVAATSPSTRQPMTEDLSASFDGVTFNINVFPAWVVEFNSNGQPTSGGGTVVTIKNQDGETKQITVSNSSGLIS